ncbi:hypothetical protein [Burkholderia ubonensis]|uniref:hypothetical protein n=1 Tax=Burkholderia ubonensis TaxID=101571 RepID=UPI000B27A3C4|nr:hypothetical protein [Burkholderia ubonensis]
MPVAPISTISSGLLNGGPSVARNVRMSWTVRAFAFVLALGATSTSAWISYLAGTERGDWMAEKIAWVAIGVVLMLSAHLIPALTRGLGRPARVAAMVVWALAILATGYTHATFFVNAQRHAGEARAAHLTDASATAVLNESGGRPVEQIANDRARVERDLAAAKIVRCSLDCGAVATRKVGLSARLTALNIELEAAQRRNRIADDVAAERARVLVRQDAVRVDPVVSRLAQVLKIGTGTLDLILSLTLGWLLEAIACVSWLVALRNPTKCEVPSSAEEDRLAASPCEVRGDEPADLAIAPKAPEPVVKVSHESQAANDSTTVLEPTMVNSDRTAGQPETTDDSGVPSSHGGGRLDSASELERLALAVREGTVRPTISSIRAHMGCTEGRALALRRQLAVLNPDLLSSRASPAA